ncbi:hypothetical protein JXI42_13165 [bacterium]|nr:hypothetical protein [bacterium]
MNEKKGIFDMARKLRKTETLPVKQKASRSKLPFSSKNYLFFGLAIISIVAGFLVLVQGSITLAPILLVLGYCVFMPLAIMLNGSKKKEEKNPSSV